MPNAQLTLAQPDCVLLDLNLPDANGIDALQHIRRLAPDTPIVVLTGLNDEHFGMSAVASGAQDYLVKGRVEPEMLRRAVLYAIERKRAELTAVELHASQLRARENARLERGLSPSPLLLDNPGVEIVARYVPSRENALLGGDFYDFVQTPDRTVHVMIGDVAGHGPDEAALGVALRIAWRALTFAGLRGPDRMRELERILKTERAGKGIFATVLSLAIPTRGIPDPRSARRASRNAGARRAHGGMARAARRARRSGLASGEWDYHQVEWPRGHGVGLAHRRAVRGTFRARATNASVKKGCSSWRARWRTCRVRRSSTRSSTKPRNAPRRTAGSPTTSRWSAWSAQRDERAWSAAHRAGLAEPGAVRDGHGGVGRRGGRGAADDSHRPDVA